MWSNAWWVSGLFLTHEAIDGALDAAEHYDASDLMTTQQIGEYLEVA